MTDEQQSQSTDQTTPLHKNELAIPTLVLGIVGLLGFPSLIAVAAVVMGHIARARIRRSGGQQKGSVMTLVGLVLGYIGSAAWVLSQLEHTLLMYSMYSGY